MTIDPSAFFRPYLHKHPRLRRLLSPAIKLKGLLWPSPYQLLSDSYEHLFKNVVGGSLRVRVSNLGTFEIGCHSDILFRVLVYRDYEPGLVRGLRKYVDPNKDVIDIGANIGFFTTLLADLVSEDRKVLAVEPTPGALRFLKKNIEAHNCARKVILFEGVAEESPGEFMLKVFPGMEEYSTLVNVAHPAIMKREYQELQVPGETIDRLVQRHSLNPGLIKIDTEGAETHVLRGARQAILDHRPIIFCESLPNELVSKTGERPGGLGELLKEMEYIVSDFEQDELLAIPKESFLEAKTSIRSRLLRGEPTISL